MNFRDTQGQDFVLETAQGWRRHKRRLLYAGIAVLVVVLLGMLLTRYLAASGSVSLSRLEVATVQQGPFVRDIAADGRVVAAVSPTLYAAAAGTVRYRVQAGDAVQKGAVLGIVDSPELTNRLAQEQAQLQSLQLAYENAHLDAQKKRLAARQKLEDARIDLKAAQTDLDRNTRAFQLGAVPQINVLRAQNALDKAQITLRHAEQDQGLDDRMVAFEIRSKRFAAERQQLIVADLQRQVDALTLRAPVTGQVGQLAVANRTKVAKDAALLSVVDLSALEVEIKVPESFARDLA
ncbi:MAG: biotin/lipoyl-binding protein, partial [Proteobacteria bacterium]|nr:biotin/lipoyl-binding protein [Pseudomonadota bacterium]